MTERLYEQDAYLDRCDARVSRADERGVVLDRTVFYAMGGGQPGDSGRLVWEGGEAAVTDTRKSDGADIVHVLEPGAPVPAPDTRVQAVIDWPRRHRHMRTHTCLHLLCALVDAPVTGGNLTAEKGRLDFDLPEASSVSKENLTEALNALIEQDTATAIQWISEAELEAQPELVKTMSVSPPRGAGRVRLLSIPGVDLQPCGGTHVARTGEIGRVRVARIEKKSRLNRRIVIVLED